MEEVVTGIFDYFKDIEPLFRKTVCAVLIVRESYKNPRTPDGFLTVVLNKYDGEVSSWNFRSLEGMMKWLGWKLTHGFEEVEPEEIEERLFDEVMKYEEARARRG